ncbi:MAG: hypothetical protein V4543_18185 [Bacteroidota bacterium]
MSESRAFSKSIGGFALLLVFAWLAFRKIPDEWDLALFDETISLYRGLHLDFFSVSPSDGPLYFVWYKLLSFWEPDPQNLYFLNIMVLGSLCSVLLYSFLLTATNRVNLSFFIAAGFMVSNANLPVWPKVSHFTLCILLIGLSAAFRQESMRHKWYIIAFTALLSSMARPEFYSAFVLCTVLALAFSIAELLKFKPAIFGPGVSPAAALREFAVFLVPSSIVIYLQGCLYCGQSRGYIAFSQHFAKNHLAKTHSALNPWLSYNKVVHEAFGNAQTVGEALAANPAAFFGHVFMNVQNLTAKCFAKVIGLLVPNISPLPAGDSAVAIKAGLILIVALALFLVHKRFKITFRYAGNLKKAGPGNLLIVLCLLFPIALSTTIVYPRGHYLVLLTPVFALLAAWLIGSINIPVVLSQRQTGLALALWIVLLPGPVWFLSPDLLSRPVLSRVQELRNLNLQGSRHILDADGGYAVYLGSNKFWVWDFVKPEPVDAFLAAHQVNTIIVSKNLEESVLVKEGAGWDEFLKGGWQARGFKSYPFSYGYVLVKD